MSRHRAVVLAFDEGYLMPGAVAATSAMEHSPDEAQLVILAVDLSAGAIDRLNQILRRWSPVIVDATEFCSSMPARFAPPAWARLGLSDLISDRFRRVVYVDADTFTRGSLGPLFDSDLRGRVLGACYQPRDLSQLDRHRWGSRQDPDQDYLGDSGVSPVAAYFNSGVLLIDMDAWRAAEAQPRLLARATELPDSFVLPDQDVLNSVLWDEWLPLDWRRWNWPGLTSDRLAWEASIVHFYGPTKPWESAPYGAPFTKEYRAAARSIGWEIAPSRYRLRDGILETVLPYSLVLRRRRITAALRRRRSSD